MRDVRRYCRCGMLLARDNAAGLCAACEAKRRRDRAPDVPPEFWQTEAMAAALDSGDIGRVVRAYRFHPFHGQPLPQELVADWLHISQATLSRIENGHRHLTVEEIAGFARSLGHSIAVRWTPLHDTGEDVDPLSRRSLFGAGVGAALGLNATTAPAAARQVDPELVSHWVKLLRVLDLHDAMCGPHEALDAVRREITLIAMHRDITHGELRRQLLRVESRWAQFAGWLSNDAGDTHSRDAWAERALLLAREADYPEMVAYVLMRQGHWAIEDQDGRRAIALADAAARVSDTTQQLRALCALKKAHGHALTHDEVACERSLAEAHELLAKADIPQSPWDQLARQEVTDPAVIAAEARCWLWLRPSKAIGMFEEALRLWPSARTRGHGVHRARLALACAAAGGEPDRAAAEGLQAVGIAQSTKSDVTARELKRLDRQLAGCDAPAAADFREAFATL